MIRLVLISVACGFLLGTATGNLSRMLEERRKADAGVGARSSPSGSPPAGGAHGADPSLPPSAFARDCRFSGREFIAWRDAGGEWMYACLDGYLARPEVVLGR